MIRVRGIWEDFMLMLRRVFVHSARRDRLITSMSIVRFLIGDSLELLQEALRTS